MARRNEHSRDQLREMALTAAETLLDQQGSEALSTRKIATAIGYSAGSLYQVFKNYDDLCWQLNQRTLAMLLVALETDTTQVLSPGQALQRYGQQYLAFALEWPQRWLLLFEHRTPLDLETPKALEQAIAQLFGKIEQPLSQMFTDRSAEQISEAARTLWAGVHGIAVLRAHNKLFQVDSAADSMASTLLERYILGWQQETSA